MERQGLTTVQTGEDMELTRVKFIAEALIKACDNGWNNADTQNKMVAISRELQLDLEELYASLNPEFPRDFNLD